MGSDRPDAIEFNILGFARRGSGGAVDLVSPCAINSPEELGSYCSFVNELDPKIDSIVIFEVTASDVAFNNKPIPFTQSLYAENKSTAVLLNKLWQLEKQVLFIAAYYNLLSLGKGKRSLGETKIALKNPDILHVGLEVAKL
jgi:hypothetical protein